MRATIEAAVRPWKPRAALAAIVVAALAITATPPAEATTATASISGHVIDKATGQPLGGVAVAATSFGGAYPTVNDGSAVTDASGNYTISGLQPGERRVAFTGPQQYAPEYWPDAPASAAGDLSTAAGQHRTGVDAALQVAASVSGTVTRADTEVPLRGVAVTLLDGFSRWYTTFSDGSGHYAAKGLLPGTYMASFTAGFDGGMDDAFVTQLWPTAFHPDEATPLSLAAGDDRTGINTAMVHPGSVTGTVTRSDTGAGVVGAELIATDSDGYDISTATTGADGRYSLGWLHPGGYTVTVHPPSVSGTANDLTVGSEMATVDAAGTTTADFVVTMGGHLSGSVRYPNSSTARVRVTAYRWDGSNWVQEATTGLNDTAFIAGSSYDVGRYDVGAVRPGAYIVKFEDPGMCTKYWNGAFTQGTATTLTIAEHKPVTGVSAYMSPSCTNPPVVPGTVSITGTPAVGSSLSAVTKGWQPTAVALAYQWYTVSGPTSTVIPGATSATFKPTTAQAGKSLKVSVTGSLPASPSFTRASSVVGKVALAPTPTISGTRAAGFTLTAKPGTWTKGTALSYAWYYNGYYIPGTSGPSHSTYKLDQNDVNTHMAVKVTGTLAGYPTVSRTSAWTAYIAQTAAPTVSGTRAVGSTLTAHPGSWMVGTKFAYRWYANGVLIAGASHSTFRLTSAQQGKTVKAAVIGSLSGYDTITRISTPTLKIALTATPTIRGTRAVGHTLTASHGTWTTGTRFGYRWYANGTYISGSSGHSAITLSSAQRGKAITVKVTGSLSGYQTITRVSAATARIS